MIRTWSMELLPVGNVTLEAPNLLTWHVPFEIESIYSQEYYVRRLEYTQDGLNLVSGSDGAVKIWDPATGVCIRTLEKYPRPFWLSLSVSSNSLVAASDYGNGVDTVQIWSIDGTCCKTLNHEKIAIQAIAFPYSPIANTLFAASNSGLLMWLL